MQEVACSSSLDAQRNAVNQLAVKYRGYTPAKAIASKEPSIHALVKANTEAQVKSNFKLHLVALSRFLNLKNGLTEEHIDYITEKLVTDYQWLKIADFAIVIDRIKSNKYGQFYENFSAQKFLEIMEAYDDERTRTIEELRADENNRLKAAPINPGALPYILDAAGRLLGDETGHALVDESKLTSPPGDEEDKRKKQLADYYSYKLQRTRDQIAAKPEEERTVKESAYLNAYDNNKK